MEEKMSQSERGLLSNRRQAVDLNEDSYQSARFPTLEN